MKIENTGKAADRLVGASTPAAERVELHTMAMDGNVMRMREVAAIDLPPGQTVALEPGRLHLMLMGLKSPLKADTKVPLTLKFEKAGEVQVELKVEAADAGPGGHQH
jgi:copper(I)-binding protein